MEKTVECTLSGRMSSLGCAEESSDSAGRERSFWDPSWAQNPTGERNYGPLLLFFEGSSSEHDKLRFVKYKGKSGVELVGMDQRVPVLAAAVECSKWKAYAFSRLRSWLLLLRLTQLIRCPWNGKLELPTWRWGEMSLGFGLTAVVRFGTYYVSDVPFGKNSIAELEQYYTARKKNAQLDTINARSSSSSSWNVGPSASDRPGAEWREKSWNGQSFLPHNFADDLVGCGLTSQVHGSMDKVRNKLRQKGFENTGRDANTYHIKMFVSDIHYGEPGVYHVKVTSNFELISLEGGFSRDWLKGSLVSSDERNAVEQSRPNCVRYLVKRRKSITGGMLRRRLDQKPILEHAAVPGGCTMRVSAEYRPMVRFVRKEREEEWASEDGLIVKLLDIMEWKGRSAHGNLIDPQKARQEVEVHMPHAEYPLLGSDMAAENFITKFWNTGLRFKEFLL